MFKNILIISDRFANGGLETHIMTYAKAFKHDMKRLILLTSLEDGYQINSLFDKVYTFNISYTDNAKRLTEQIDYIENIIEKEKIDYLIVHPFMSFLPAFFASQNCQIPLMGVIHGPMVFDGGRGRLYDFFIKNIFLNYAYIMYVSPETMALSLGYGQTSQSRYFSNPIDTKLYQNVQVDRDIFAKWAIVSRIDQDKLIGIQKFLETAKEFHVSQIDIYGSGTAFDVLKEYIKNLDMQENVTLKGFSSDLNRVLSDRYSLVAGMGRVVLEASAMNIPVLLVGYDGIKGLLDKELFLQTSWANFSGRNLTTLDFENVSMQLKMLNDQYERFLLREVVIETYAIENLYSELKHWMEQHIFLQFPHMKMLREQVVLATYDDIPYLQHTSLLSNISIFLKNSAKDKLRNKINTHETEWLYKEKQAYAYEKQRLQQTYKDEKQRLQKELKTIENSYHSEYEKNLSLIQENEILKSALNVKYREVESIYTSNMWKVAQKYYTIKDTIKNTKTYMQKAIKLFAREGISGLYLRFRKGSIDKFNPYSFIQPFHEIKFEKKDSSCSSEKLKSLKFSVVMPVLNEEETLTETLDSICTQNVKPDEIIIVDGGSKDNTVQLTKNYIENESSDIVIQLIQSEQANIAYQRNLGMKQASNEIILLCDFGCSYQEVYFHHILCGFLDDEVDLVAGRYQAKDSQNNYANSFIPDWNYLDLDKYLPGGATTAVKKSLVEKIGFYPEYLQNTGEDTYFSLNYRRVSRKWILATNAIAIWSTPTEKEEYKKKRYSYGYGDGLNGLGYFLYPHYFDTHIVDDYIRGIKDGRKKLPQIEINKRHINGIVIILSGVPMTDSGGGQRGAQFACEFIRQNYKVFFVNRYPSYEKKEKVFFDIDYSLLELSTYEKFNIEEVLEKYKELLSTSIVISEIPHTDFLTYSQVAKSKGLSVVYDYIDNWDTSLGGDWYSVDTEKRFLNVADHVIASAKSLQKDLQEKTVKKVELVPNAVNTVLFSQEKQYQIPDDLPQNGKPNVIYIGAMWGDWFDWKLMEYCFEKNTNVNFVFIGQAHNNKIEQYQTYHNVYFLGLKKQYELPTYLSYANLTLIPFKNDNIVKYVNPLKIYEYLAMYKPVLAMYYKEIADIPGVYFANTKEEFADKIEYIVQNQSQILEENKEAVKQFIEKNNWTERVNQICEMLHKVD